MALETAIRDKMRELAIEALRREGKVDDAGKLILIDSEGVK